MTVIRYDGPVCKRGHRDGRYIKNGGCVTCVRDNARRWKIDNREQALKTKREGSRRRYATDPSKQKIASSNFAKRNPDTAAAHARKRRAAKMSARGSHTKSEIYEIIDIQGWRCANPNCLADLSEHGYDVDHVWPLSRGGSNSAENLQCLCKSCNSSKGAKLPINWMMYEMDKAHRQ